MKMKLVQLLAKELKEWPEDDEGSDPILFITQHASGEIFSWNDNGELKFADGRWYMQGTIPFDEVIFDGSETCSDCSSAIVREDQWQYEREKMNKPKWIRHRGMKQPVNDGVTVEVKLRSGSVQTSKSENFIWSYGFCDSSANIMQYRVIEESKDQEIEEVKKTNFGALTYKLEIDATEATKEIDSLVAKWGQIESPLKWRDAIIHCQAIIEDCEREIQRNVNLLDAEGLMMQKDSKKAMQYYQTDIDMSDWRNWQACDIFEVVKKTDYFTVGNRYSVKYTANTDAPITATDDDGDEFCLLMEEIKFIRRP